MGNKMTKNNYQSDIGRVYSKDEVDELKKRIQELNNLNREQHCEIGTLLKEIQELKQFEKMYLNAKEQCDVFTKQIQELKKENIELGLEINDLKDNITLICKEDKDRLKELKWKNAEYSDKLMNETKKAEQERIREILDRLFLKYMINPTIRNEIISKIKEKLK